jgi:hypothetical protein
MAINDILIIPSSGTIEFTGSQDSNIKLQVEPSGSVAFYGESGSIVKIADTNESSLLSVNTQDGTPIFQVFDDRNVTVSGSLISSAIEINGGEANLVITGSVVTGIFDATVNLEPVIPVDIYSGAAIEYTAQRQTAIRTGIIMASWSGSEVTFTDISNSDIGETWDLSFNLLRINDSIRLRAYSLGSGSGGWNIKVLYKLFPNLL